MSNEQLVMVEPMELRFPRSEDKTSCRLHVSNQTSSYVAFKFKTTNPKGYRVQPKAGVLLPKSVRDVVVTTKWIKAASPNIQCRDMFLLQSLKVNDGMTNADVKWHKVAGHQIEMQKLKVVFLPPDQLHSPVVEGSQAMRYHQEIECSSAEDAFITSDAKDVPGIADERVECSLETSVTSKPGLQHAVRFLKREFSEPPTVSDSKSKSNKVKREHILGLDIQVCARKHKKKSSPNSLFSEAFDDIMAVIDTTTTEEQVTSCREASLQITGDASCQDEKAEEPILPEDGGNDVDNRDHAQQEMDNQDHAFKEVESTMELCKEYAETETSVAMHGVDPVPDELPRGTLYENQPFLLRLNGHDPRGTEAQQDDKTDGEGCARSCSNDFPSDLELGKETQIPFVRTLPIWEKLESMEAFKLMPQRPHFAPLVKWSEETREGMAVSFMVIFATLVEKISTLQPDGPGNVIHRYLQTLADLELLGFNVKAAVDRLSILSSIKEMREKHQNMLQDVQTKIAKNVHDKVKLEESIDRIDRDLKELANRRASCKSFKEAKESEVAAWRLDSSDISRKVSSAEGEFQTLVSAPW